MSSEIKDMAIADAALTIAFAIIFTGGIGGVVKDPVDFLYFIPIAFVAVSLSFILHEYMHKVVAQKFGAMAAFRKWDWGIGITLVTSFFGFLIGLPGATMIYTSRFTQKEEGYVSLAGPLTNFAVFLVVLAVWYLTPANMIGKYVQDMISVTLFISVWLAFFNMLPIYPLDGSKVLRWNKAVYAVTMLVIFFFLYIAIGPANFASFLPSLIIVLIIALFMSMMYRGMAFRF